ARASSARRYAASGCGSPPSADLTIAPAQGLAAHFDPAAQVLPVPGTSSFLLLVDNTGNTEDAYTATVMGTTGPVTASLMGLDGRPTQAVPVFRLPGLSTGAILLQTNLAAAGQGDVTVQVQSLGDPTRPADGERRGAARHHAADQHRGALAGLQSRRVRGELVRQ